MPLLTYPVDVEKGTKAVISASTANEHSITYEQISLSKFPEKSFSTPTGFNANYPPCRTEKENVPDSGDESGTLIEATHFYNRLAISRHQSRAANPYWR
jgi:hypothetical protein